MAPAIRAHLPTPWRYNLKNYKSQDILDRKYEIYPETREADRPVWKTECLKKRKRNSILSRFPGIEDAAQFFGQGFDPMGFLQEAGRAVGQQVVDRGR